MPFSLYQSSDEVADLGKKSRSFPYSSEDNKSSINFYPNSVSNRKLDKRICKYKQNTSF